MAWWLVRGGSDGGYEQKFLEDGRIYLTWTRIEEDMRGLSDLSQIQTVLRRYFPTNKEGNIIQNSGQFMSFLQRMRVGDQVIMPRKRNNAISIGQITGDCMYDPQVESVYRHWRPVRWTNPSVPRTNFDSELVHKLNAATTICRIEAVGIDERVTSAIKGTTPPPKPSPGIIDRPADPPTDVESQSRTDITQLVQAKFKGHELEVLVEEILKAQGYTTFRSAPGADRGIDILAGSGVLGFDSPRIAVQVKSESSPVGQAVLNQLLGAMTNFKANQGLLVSWSGFTDPIWKQEPDQFFTVRLWDSEQLINELLDVYEKLPATIRTQIPLKRIWVLTDGDSQ